MANLNLDKAIEKGKEQVMKHSRYCMRFNDIRALASRKNLYDCVSDSFYFGFIQGMKAASRKQ